MHKPVLSISNFGQLHRVNLKFGDLTVLVGSHGTGKGLALQWLKAVLDGRHLIELLRQTGHAVARPESCVDLIFGRGMRAAWTRKSQIWFNGKRIGLGNLKTRGSGTESVFFIPAHRALLLASGRPELFRRLTPDIPVVARIFSQNLHDCSSAGGDWRFLRKYYASIKDTVFHGGAVVTEEGNFLSPRQLRLVHDGVKLPFMAWSAGQREFIPLLLGLRHLLPKNPGIRWVVIEDPEAGLHPQAINIVLLLILDLLKRGYRVVISTNSLYVITAIWMLQLLSVYYRSCWRQVCWAFGAPETAALKEIALSALRKSYKFYLFEFGPDYKVMSRNISYLTPDSFDPLDADWTGLTGFKCRFGSTVSSVVAGRRLTVRRSNRE